MNSSVMRDVGRGVFYLSNKSYIYLSMSAKLSHFMYGYFIYSPSFWWGHRLVKIRLELGIEKLCLNCMKEYFLIY